MQNPSLPDFLAWVRGVMGIPSAALPDDAPVILYVYELTAESLEPLICYFYGSPVMWKTLFFNLAGSFLINDAPDVEGSTYFENLRRKTFSTMNMTAGVVSSASDESTSTSLLVGQAMSNLSLADLQRLKDPYGAKALSILMELGPLWGIS